MNRFVSWIKENKVAAAAVAGIGFLFLAKKGGGGGTADAILVPTAVESANASEGAYEYRDQGDAADDYVEGFKEGLELGRDDEDQPEKDPGPEQGDEKNPPTPDRQGVTIMGHFFAGATGYTISRVDGQGWTEYLVKFQGRNERWQFHPSFGWTQGWRNPTASAPAPEPVPQPAPVVPIPTPDVVIPPGGIYEPVGPATPAPTSGPGSASGPGTDNYVSIPLAGGGVYIGPPNKDPEKVADRIRELVGKAPDKPTKQEIANRDRNTGGGKGKGK